MLRRYWLWGTVLGIAGVLATGCSTTGSEKNPSRVESPHRVRQQELQEEREAQRTAEAHAHYSSGVIHEMNGEAAAATEDYYQAAVLDPDNESLVLEVSRRFLQSKQPGKALDVLTRAAARPQASGEIYARLGLVYTQLGKNDQAISAIRVAIKKSPDSISGYRNLFVSYLQTKQPQQALKALDDAASRSTADTEFLIDLSELYMNLGLEAPSLKEVSRTRSLAMLRRADKLGTANPALRLRLAEGFNLTGDTATAARLYLELLKKMPDMPGLRERVRANLTDIYLRSSNHKMAAEQLEAIVRDDPTNPQAYYFLGRIALEDKKPAEAADHFSKMIVLSPTFEPAYYFLAMAQINQGKSSDALATLEKARKQFPQSFAMEFWTAMAYSREKAYVEALRHYTAAEVIAKVTDPKQLDEGFYFQLGATCERKGDYDQAEKYFQKCLALAPDSAEAMNYLGYMWAEHGMKLDQARELIEKAVKAEPKNAAYLDSLAWVLFKLNRPKEALPQALKAVEFSEEPDPTVYDHLGDIYGALHQTEKAREAWKKSVSLEPNDEVKKKLDGESSAEDGSTTPTKPE
jgi:tetratricopeptide (TPR) repeat protein